MRVQKSRIINALRLAAQDIPRPSENAGCHIGVVSMQQCGRCSRAATVYAVLDTLDKPDRRRRK